MKINKLKLAVPIFLLFFGGNVDAQGNIYDYISTWEKDLPLDYNQEEVDSRLFNYNTYKEVAVDEYLESIPTNEKDIYTLFLVFNFKGTDHIATLTKGKTQIVLASSELISRRNTPLDMDEHYPHILSYKGKGADIKSKEDISELLVGNLKPELQGEGKVNIAEFMVFDKVLNTEQSHMIESALALKYGVSLPIDKAYINSDLEIIWEKDVEDEFTDRLSGIIRDDYHNLFVPQSSNSRDDINFTIALEKIGAFKTEELQSIKDKEYFLWSDNNEEVAFNEETDGTEVLGRKWQFKRSDGSIQDQVFAVELELKKSNDYSFYDYFIGFDKSFSIKEITRNNNFIKGTFIDKRLQFDKVKISKAIGSEGYLVIFRKLKPSLATASDIKIIAPSLVHTKQDFNISMYNPNRIDGKLFIQSISGKVIDQFDIPSEIMMEKDISGISLPGSYLISIESDQGIFSKKLIVQ